MDELKAAGVEFDPAANKETLEALLESHNAPKPPPVPPAAPPAPPAPPVAPVAPVAPAAPAAPSHADQTEVEVGDPLSLKPVDLPLVVKPKEGQSWKNEEQARFAATLNAHAYQFPESWAKKKDKLVAQLIEIGTNPSLFYVLAGEPQGQPKVVVNDKRFGQGN